jgi:beclin 1-associated autophagy-related key regulator
LLEKLMEEKKVNIQKLNETKKENHDKNRAQSRILPKYEDKVNKLGDYVLEAMEKNENLRKKSLEQMEQLQHLRREYIDKLVKFIFPMSQKIAKGSSVLGHRVSNDSLKTETMSEIAEAMMTTNLKNEWSCVEQYVIVAPSLKANGNYQEYYDWIHNNKDGTVNSGMNPAAGTSDPGQVASNHAYRIAAALTYITQLVQALSFFLDVRLPHKVTCNDFCTMGLNEQQFRKKVARLNLNIVYLCYTQNLSMKTIHPPRTMENVFQLLDIRNAGNLGRTGPVLDSSQRSVDSIMQSFTEIFDDDHSDTDDEDDSEDTMLQKDWENVGNLPLVEIQSAMVPQQTVSMAGTLMNVAQSLWKWK